MGGPEDRRTLPPPTTQAVGESVEGFVIAFDGHQVGRGPGQGSQPRSGVEPQERTRHREQGALLDPRCDEDVGGGVARAERERLVTVGGREGCLLYTSRCV